MTKELEPCPFCGGEATVKHGSGGYIMIECSNSCHLNPSLKGYYPPRQAIDIWNTRYKRTCHNIGDYDKDEEFKCSECGHIDRLFEYSPEVGEHCKGCGAEVVDGD